MKDTKEYAPATINQKTAAIREFLSYASARNPELVVYLRGFSEIPRQKTDTWASVSYMSGKCRKCHTPPAESEHPLRPA